MKLTKAQKALLENKIYHLIKESFFENNFLENGFFEKKHKKEKDDDKEGSSSEGKREIVMKWLNTEQQLHSVLAYKLWPDTDKDQARSDFSKKWRGEDNTHKPYSFDDEEINILYNLRNDFIKRGSLDKDV